MNAWELALLDVLANHLRFLAVPQLARASFAGQRPGKRTARRAQRLADFGWLRVTEVFARPVRPMAQPLCQWRHAEPAPDFTHLSRRLHRRASFPARLTVVISATAKTCQLLGVSRSSTLRIKLTQTTHDLQVAELFLHYATWESDPGVHWVSDDALPATWPVPQRPDALLVDDAGQFVRAIEYGGDYSQERLADLHYGLASIPLPYEIW